MKKILSIIICIFLLASCSGKNKDNDISDLDNVENTEQINNQYNPNKEYTIYNTWVPLDNTINSYRFNEDGSYTILTTNNEVVDEGTFEVEEDDGYLSISIRSNNNDSTNNLGGNWLLKDGFSASAKIVNNVLIFLADTAFVVEGEEPYLITEYTKYLVGYWQDAYLYHYYDDGILEYYDDIGKEEYKYIADQSGVYYFNDNNRTQWINYSIENGNISSCSLLGDGCWNWTKLDETTYNNLASEYETKYKLRLTNDSIIGTWHRLSSFPYHDYQIFNSDGTYEWGEENHNENYSGAYSIDGSKLYTQYDYYYEYDEGSVNSGTSYSRNKFMVLGDLLFLETSLYYREGKDFNLTNEYTTQFEGYWEDEGGRLYNFDSNGNLDYYSDELYKCKYSANFEQLIFYSTEGAQAIGGSQSYYFKNNDLYFGESGYSDNIKLTKLDETAFNEKVASETYKLHWLYIEADAIKVRKEPSTSSEEIGKVKKGEKYTYSSFDYQEDYYWYYIDELGGYIASKWNEDWVRVLSY